MDDTTPRAAARARSRRGFLGTALAAAAAAGLHGLSRRAGAAEPAGARSAGRHTLMVLNPGHFHAGLTLRASHPRIADDVYVYAPAGPDVENFLRMVATFNQRAENPTRWKLHVRRVERPLDTLLSERPGDVVVLSGRNDIKMQSITRLHAEGLSVLGDKPWLIGAGQLPGLHAATARPPLAMDIMTERHQIATQLQQALLGVPEVFGEFRIDGPEPAIFLKSVHHLYKIVNERPLVRPAWFFDTAVQGEGMMDVTTHLVDLAHWFAADGALLDYQRDLRLESARQWPTEVPRDIFSRITGLDDFPAAIRARVRGDALHYLCNAAIDWRLRGVPVRIESLWNLRIPEGGGDTHYAAVRGTRATLIVDQGPQTGYLTRLSVHPAGDAPVDEGALARAVGALQPAFPGVGYRRDGAVLRLDIPPSLRTGHEAHFAAVLEQFIGHVDSGRWPPNLMPDLVAKYTLLARARELSAAGG
jgi:predicted dehydrogenase